MWLVSTLVTAVVILTIGRFDLTLRSWLSNCLAFFSKLFFKALNYFSKIREVSRVSLM